MLELGGNERAPRGGVTERFRSPFGKVRRVQETVSLGHFVVGRELRLSNEGPDVPLDDGGGWDGRGAVGLHGPAEALPAGFGDLAVGPAMFSFFPAVPLEVGMEAGVDERSALSCVVEPHKRLKPPGGGFSPARSATHCWFELGSGASADSCLCASARAAW